MMATGAKNFVRFIDIEVCCLDDNGWMSSFEKVLILVINLDRSPLRLEKIAGQLDRLGLVWQRLPAADGKNLDLTDTRLLDLDGFRRLHGKMPLVGELGCYLSHVWCMERLLSTENEYALIVEDDALLGDDLPTVLSDLIANQADWDMVKLSGMHGGTPLRVGTLSGGRCLAVPLSRYTGSSCYLVNRKVAALFADRLLPMKLPYDHEYDRAWDYGFKMRMVVPAPCKHTFELGSELNPFGVERLNFHWTKRLQVYGWRLVNEFKRLVYGLSQWVLHRRA
jgi:glycosyl transferase family 25